MTELPASWTKVLWISLTKAAFAATGLGSQENMATEWGAANVALMHYEAKSARENMPKS